MLDTLRTACPLALGLVLPFCVLLPSAQAQGLLDGFMRGAGKTDIAVSTAWETFEDFYVGTERMDLPLEIGSITRMSYNLFVAHGITERLDVVASLPFVSVTTDGGGAPDMDDLQDVSVFLKLRAWQTRASILGAGTFSITPALGLKTPFGDYGDDTIVSIGHRSTDVDGRVILQYTLDSGLFGSLQGGYIGRDGVPPDAVPLVAKLGYAGRRIYFDAWYDQQTSRGGADLSDGLGFAPTGVDYRRVGVGAYFSILPSIGLSAGVGQTLSGRNAGRSTQFSAGVVYRLGS